MHPSVSICLSVHATARTRTQLTQYTYTDICTHMHTYAPSTHANTHAHAALTNSEDVEHIGYDLSQKPSAGQYLRICPATLHTPTPTPTPTPKHKIPCWTRLSRSGTNKRKTSLNTSPLCRSVFVPDRNTLWRDSAGGWKKEREVLLLS